MASSNFEPSEESINHLMEFFPIDRQQAIRRLKGNNNNVESAVNEYLDDAPGSTNKYAGWDETQFNSDREGGNTGHGIAFDIQGPDDHGASRFPPTRPPSRTDTKSPLRNIIDLTAVHAAADPSTSYGGPGQEIMSDEDRQMQEAIALSRESAGMPPQESGVTNNGTDQVHFGPATRQDYETGQWSMVPLGKSGVQEWLADPDPADRTREPGQPAFLKPSVQNHRLGALMTIYHEIPMVRNIFLNSVDVAAAYGSDTKNWWSGTPIDLDENQDPSVREMDRELQRLMAFLDHTDRSYGSVEPLLLHPSVQKMMRTGANEEAAVMDAWRRHIDEFNSGNKGMIKKIFSIGVSSEESDEERQSQKFAILELTLPPKEGEKSEFETLYDIADDVLWTNLEPFDLKRSPYLSHVADVIAFRITGGQESKPVDIPLVWYPDRYLQANREAALKMRVEKRDVKENIKQVSELMTNLSSMSLRKDKVVKVSDLFTTSTRHDEAELEEKDESDFGEVPPSPAASKLSAELQKVVASIDRKLAALHEERTALSTQLRTLSTLLIQPSSFPTPDTPNLRKYTLRGISTSKTTLYLCRHNPSPDLITLDPSNPSETDTWFRICFGSLIDISKVETEEVLEASKKESKNLLLVYASEKAMEMPPHDLPRKLELFVKRDNRFFREELEGDVEMGGWNQVQNGEGSGSPDTLQGYEAIPDGGDTEAQKRTPSSPGKRKFSETEEGEGEGEGWLVREREVRESSSESGASAVSGDTVTGPPNLISSPTPEPGRGTKGEELFGTSLHDQIIPVEEKVRGRGREVLAGRGGAGGGGQEMSERGPGLTAPLLGGVRNDDRGSQSELRTTLDAMDLDELEMGDVSGAGSGAKGGGNENMVGFVEEGGQEMRRL